MTSDCHSAHWQEKGALEGFRLRDEKIQKKVKVMLV